MDIMECPFCKGEGKVRWVWRGDGTKFVAASEATPREKGDTAESPGCCFSECHGCLGHGLLSRDTLQQSVVATRGY